MEDIGTHIRISEHQRITSFSYYEYKYRVSHSDLPRIKEILAAFCKDSDPFPCGIVDSIYYDTCDEKLLSQCVDGDAEKSKFRIRGYGDGSYNQVHQKMKDLSSVKKYKAPIELVQAPREMFPLWEDLYPRQNFETFHVIQHNGRRQGMLTPSIRVKYLRYRYRLYDYRMTLDTNIEVFSPMNGLPRKKSYAAFPHHTLEIKTRDIRPTLPFNGLIKLPQISFSKFMIGLMLLN